jgi:hypothetical protein
VFVDIAAKCERRGERSKSLKACLPVHWICERGHKRRRGRSGLPVSKCLTTMSSLQIVLRVLNSKLRLLHQYSMISNTVIMFCLCTVRVRVGTEPKHARTRTHLFKICFFLLLLMYGIVYCIEYSICVSIRRAPYSVLYCTAHVCRVPSVVRSTEYSVTLLRFLQCLSREFFTGGLIFFG